MSCVCINQQNLLDNGDFSDWTTNDPDSWTVSTEDGSNYIEESDSSCRLVSDGSYIGMSQIILTVGKFYDVEIVVDSVISGGIVVDIGGSAQVAITAAGTYNYNNVEATSLTYIEIKRNTACDVYFDNVTAYIH